MMSYHGLQETPAKPAAKRRNSAEDKGKGGTLSPSIVPTSAATATKAKKRNDKASPMREPPLKIRKIAAQVQVVRSAGAVTPICNGDRLVLKWMAQSLRPLSILQDPGLVEILQLVNANNNANHIIQLVQSACMDIKKKMHTHLKLLLTCDPASSYSLSAQVWPAKDKRMYCSVMITFLTCTFERKSYTLAVVPLVTTTAAEPSCSVKQTTAILEKVANEFGLPEHQRAFLTLGTTPVSSLQKGAYDAAAASSSSSSSSQAPVVISCVLTAMHNVVCEGIKKEGRIGTLLAKIRAFVTYLKNMGPDGGGVAFQPRHVYVEQADKKLSELSMEDNDDSSNCAIKNTYAMLQRLLDVQKHVRSVEFQQNKLGRDSGSVWVPDAEDWSIMVAIHRILRPFYDAVTTWSNERYPSIGLSITVVRRLRDIVSSAEIDSSCFSDGGDAAESVKEFRDTLLESLGVGFQSLLSENSSFQWMIPLDPRLVGMRGLSEEEKKVVMKRLVKEVKALEVIPRSVNAKEEIEGEASDPAVTDAGNDTTAGGSAMSGLGLFLDDDEDQPAIETNNKDKTEVSEAYAQACVNRYLHMIRSNRKIRDPLSWWRANESTFPELSKLARKYLGASTCATLMAADRKCCPEVMMKRRKSHPDSEHVELLSFLHDNFHLIE
jgi:hypothetical protein